MKKHRLSIDDIAQSLGVSKTLVSLVINGKAENYGIATETRQRVMAKANELGYQANHIARSLRLGKSFTIGLIVSDIANPFYAQAARLLEDHAYINDYTLITCSTDEDIEKEKKILQNFIEKQVDGIIISSSQVQQSILEKHYHKGLPIVLIDRTVKGSDLPSVSVDNAQGAYLATKHLVFQGFHRPMALAITPSHISTIKSRVDGYTKALAEKNLQPRIYEISYNNSFSEVETLLKNLYRQNSFPDSIFTLNNNLATAVLHTLNLLHLEIPRQVGLISFDDVSFFSFMNPGISAISQPIEKICQTAFRLLINQIEKSTDKKNINQVVLPVNLRIRQSTQKNTHTNH
ncbi:MAG: LacI family DNA-binding transcriptional regulator [Bacteroidales bacterium]|nr:LacI family DNA-binding transcriptional regulator [Bacteroidales bacterium]